MIAAEADYADRISGNGPQPPFRWEDGPSIEEIAAFQEETAAALLDVVQRFPPDHLVHEEEDGQFIDYQAGLLFLQAINHGIEHRTNVTSTLSSLGLQAPEVDGWAYLFAHPERFSLKEGSL